MYRYNKVHDFVVDYLLAHNELDTEELHKYYLYLLTTIDGNFYELLLMSYQRIEKNGYSQEIKQLLYLNWLIKLSMTCYKLKIDMLNNREKIIELLPEQFCVDILDMIIARQK
jgi:hypothetical protein